MQRLILSIVFLGWCAAPSFLVAADTVKLEKKDDQIVVTIGGKEFTTYRTAKSQKKPFFFPVLAADGANVARGLENPEDHPHHKGIWCAIDEVNAIKFWAEQGTIANASVEIVTAEGNPAVLRVVNHWQDAEGKPLVLERVNVAIHADRLVDYDLEFVAGAAPVTFGDTKEGMFGIRVADTLRGKSGGKISNAEGLQGEKECWGKESKWVDYVGQIGGKTYGVAIFDHPGNSRKSRFHVRDYGLFTVSPFGQNAYTNGQLPADPKVLTTGQSVRLRYGLYVHDGDTAAGQVAQRYEAFLKAPAKR
ncbi:MAG: PmoA family protein [Planctomycetales bacterium]